MYDVVYDVPIQPELIPQMYILLEMCYNGSVFFALAQYHLTSDNSFFPYSLYGVNYITIHTACLVFLFLADVGKVMLIYLALFITR